jgi:thiol-disulfide isomerase/thioredoxin
MKKLYFIIILTALIWPGSGVLTAEAAPDGNNKPLIPVIPTMHVYSAFSFDCADCLEIQPSIDQFIESFKDKDVKFIEFHLTNPNVIDHVQNRLAMLYLVLKTKNLEKKNRNIAYNYFTANKLPKNSSDSVVQKSIENFLNSNKIMPTDMYLDLSKSYINDHNFIVLNSIAKSISLYKDFDTFKPPFMIITDIDIFEAVQNPRASVTPGYFHLIYYSKEAGIDVFLSEVSSCIEYNNDLGRDLLNMSPCQQKTKPPENKKINYPLSQFYKYYRQY